eukprot:SAG11_NODE_10826_length_803_cov_1.315341_1_plen_57_part_10
MTADLKAEREEIRGKLKPEPKLEQSKQDKEEEDGKDGKEGGEESAHCSIISPCAFRT